LILFGIAVAAVAGTWTTLSATVDEPFHVACGMQWLDKGIYTYEAQHPPLARIAIALVPYLKGVRTPPIADAWAQGSAILSGGVDHGNLAAARSGNLPFLAIAALAVFLWARRWFSIAAAFWAVLLFLSLPPILGHAGLASLDMACAATVALALYAFVRCVEAFSWQKLVFLGVSLATAFLCRLSSIAFLVACFFSAFVYFVIQSRGVCLKSISWRSALARFSVLSVVVFVVLWAGYRFDVRPLANRIGTHGSIDRIFPTQPVLRRVAYAAIETPLPLTFMVRGLNATRAHDANGHAAYLLGEVRDMGWWYYFPLMVLLKTPIGFLILSACGIFAILRGFHSRTWQQHLTLIFPAAIMLVCMRSHVDLGIRNALPIFPILAVICGFAITEFFALAKRALPALAVVPILLAGWVVADCWIARPDYLAYFNRFAGPHPEKIVADSDIDWGQDLYRLSRRLNELHVDHVSVLYFGTSPLDRAGLPSYTVVPAAVPVTHGYLAVSVRYLTFEYVKTGSTAWLKDRAPLEIIGKSIYLYNLGP
jgi:4-amino-4-deoxy-L-arabinose transferase-like glycosyltransferase